MSTFLSILVGVLIILLLCLIALQRREIRELAELGTEVAQQSKDLYEQIGVFSELVKSNVRLLSLLAGEDGNSEDSAKMQSTETSEDSK